MHKKYKILPSGALFKVDLFFLEVRKKIKSRFLDIILQWIGTLDEQRTVMFVIYAYVIYLLPDKFYSVHFILLVLLSDQICKRFLKDRIKRHRPHHFCDKNYEENHLFKKFRGYVKRSASSMCSSHTANFYAQGLFISYLLPEIMFLILPLFFIVGIGRWFIGAHWFSDVIVGWIVGYISYYILLLFEEDILELMNAI